MGRKRLFSSSLSLAEAACEIWVVGGFDEQDEHCAHTHFPEGLSNKGGR